MLNRWPRRAALWPARGLSLVELMVGITVGLFIVAAASLLMSTQLLENRKLLLETQLQQDLRAAADIIARELRRSGYNALSETSVWNPTVGAPVRNVFLGVNVTSGSQGGVEYDYKRLDNAPGPFGYRVDAGVLKVKLSATSAEQELTDKNVVYVERLEIDLNSSPPVVLPCPKDCPGPIPAGAGADYCWPTTAVRELVVGITGRSASDGAVRRSVQSTVRLRNDQVLFRAGNPADPQACPE
ncbi:MAG: hypothetical protein H7Z19_10380 [Chitinophagaceae bacterium]|nr:hypothetical protein [Rubrivivax sp.]